HARDRACRPRDRRHPPAAVRADVAPAIVSRRCFGAHPNRGRSPHVPAGGHDTHGDGHAPHAPSPTPTSRPLSWAVAFRLALPRWRFRPSTVEAPCPVRRSHRPRRPVRRNMRFTRSPRTFYRLVAVAEAITWTLLIAGLLLKYVFDSGDLGVRVGGTIHGFVFLVYGATAILVGVNQRWPVGLIAT